LRAGPYAIPQPRETANRAPFRVLLASVKGIVTILILVAVVFAQESQIPLQYQYQHWPDPSRNEGIRLGNAAGGERVELVSALARPALRASQNPDRLFLGFSTESAEDVVVTVRDPDNNYWMEPADELGKPSLRAKAGFNTFSWKATDINHIHRTAGDLLALVQLPGQQISIAPAVLWDSSSSLPSNLRVDEYAFAFLPNAKADFKYEIQTKRGEVLKAGDLIDLPQGVVFMIPWNAAARPDDTYQLHSTSSFVLANGKKVEQQIQFSFFRRAAIQVSSN
jgi:hypothetical protein